MSSQISLYNKKMGYLFLILISVILFSNGVSQAEHEIENRRILVLHEIADASPGRMLFSNELFRLMRENETYNINVAFEFLGLNLLDSDEFPTEAIESLRYVAQNQEIDLVLSLLPSASEFLLEYGDMLFPDVPKVFVLPGSSSIDQIMTSPQSSIVLSSADTAVRRTVQDIFTILPETEHLVVVTGSSNSDLSYLSRIQDILPEIIERDITVEYLVGFSYPKLEQTLKNLPENTAILLSLYERDADGQIYQFSEVAHLLSIEANAPIFTFIDTILNQNVVGGTTGSMKLYAQSSARVIFDVLDRPKDESYNIIVEAGTMTVYDAAQLQHWNIPQDRLPEDHILLNDELTFWDVYGSLIILTTTIILIQMGLIVALVTARQQRRRVESSLRNSEARFRAIFDNSIDAIGVSANGKHVVVNGTYREIFDIPSTAELYETSILNYIAPDEQERIKAYAKSRTTDNNAPKFYETRGKRTNGQEFDMEVRLSTFNMDDEVYSVVFLRDITEQKRASALLQARIRLSEYAITHSVSELLQKTLDEAEILTQSHIGFFHFLAEDQNKILLQAWSTNTQENMCTMEGSEMHYPIDKAGAWADAARMQEIVIHNDFNDIENRTLPEGHSPIRREMVVPIIRYDRVVAILGVGNKMTNYTREDKNVLYQFSNMVWDIVTRSQAESSLRKSEEVVALKDQFISMISHEFRTPMAVIQTSSDMLQNYYDRMSEERKRQLLTQIGQQINHMTQMVTNTLTISRTQRGKIEFVPEQVEIEPFCQRMLDQVKLTDTIEHQYHFEVTLRDKYFFLDEHLMEHVVINLLMNAAKYTPEGGDISLIVFDDAEELNLIVKDTGIGIPDEAKPNLFDSFYRAPNVGNIQGTGLGLAIVLQFVQLHGGTIEIESQQDVGSTFKVILPKNTKDV